MECSIELLVGKTIQSVTVGQFNDTIDFECKDGSCFQMYHMQDCCESVSIYDGDDSLKLLVGKQITEATEDTSATWPEDAGEREWYPESYTWTVYTMKAGDITARVRWLGESNGYYSESVYFQRTHKPVSIGEENA